MAVYNLILSALTALLSTSPLPAWARELLLKGVQMAFTPEALAALEAEGVNFVISQLERLKNAYPGSKVTADFIAEIEALLKQVVGSPASA